MSQEAQQLAAAAAEIQRLQAQLSLAQQVNTQQAQQIAQVQHQAVAAAAAQAAAGVSPSPGAHAAQPVNHGMLEALKAIKPQAPSTFKGSVGASAEQWLLEVERWRQAVELRGAMSDAAFLITVATYLHDTASLWYQSVEPRPATWDEFKQRFRERFRPINADRMARDKLFRLQQRDNHSVSAYTNAFLELMSYLPNMAVEDQVDNYQRRLLPAIRDELDRIMANADDSDTLNLGWVINQAQRIESRLAMNKRAGQSWRAPSQAQYNPASTYRVSTSSAATSSGSADSNRMDLSQLDAQSQAVPNMYGGQKTEWTPAWWPAAPAGGDQDNLAVMYNGARNNNRGGPHLSRPEFDQLSREGRCFNCKQPGHLARNCPRMMQYIAQNQPRLK